MPLFLQDARYGLRLLVRRPGFSLVAVLTLALGIGAATSIFSVVEAVLLRPMPFPNPDRLVLMGIVGRNAGEFPLPDSDFVEWRERNRTADAVAAYSEQRINITGDGQPERVQGAVVTDQFFRILGTPAERGRVFQEGDDRPGAQKVAVISHRFWQRRFNSRADIVGQTAVLGGLPHTIVGVMPPTFAFPWHDTDVWAVLTMNPPVRRGPFYTNGLARLKEGVTMDQLRANLKDVAAEMKRRYPGPSDWRLDAKPLQEAFVAGVSRILWVLLGAVGFLLLIATANVANLLLARAATREREMALRGALGAGGWRSSFPSLAPGRRARTGSRTPAGSTRQRRTSRRNLATFLPPDSTRSIETLARFGFQSIESGIRKNRAPPRTSESISERSPNSPGRSCQPFRWA